MKSIPRKVWFVFTIAALLLLGFYLAKSGPLRQDLRFDPTPLQTFAYTVHYEVDGQSWVNPLVPDQTQAQKSRIEVEALLSLRFEQKERDGLLFSFLLTPSVWNVQLMSRNDSGEKPREIAGQFSMAEDGRIQKFFLNPEQIDAYSPWMADIFALMSVSLPNGKDSSWTSIEQSFQSSGKLQWSLAHQAGSQLRLTRQYLDNVKQQPELSGEGQVEVDTKAYLVSVTLKRQRRYIQNQVKIADDLTLFRLDRVSQGGAATIIPNMMDRGKLLEETLQGKRYLKQQEKATAQHILGMSSAAEVKAELASIDQTQMKDSIPTYQKLKALFLLYPEQMKLFRGFVLDYPYSDLRCAHVLTALTAVGSPEAQAFLRDLYSDLAGKTPMQKQIIPHISMIRLPDEASEQFIREQTRDSRPEIHTTAQLALGTIAHQVRDENPTRSMVILQEQKSRLEATPEEKLNALRSIGNIGLAQQVEVLQPYLADQDIGVRRVAIEALRHVQTPEARSILLNALQSDKDVGIRLIAGESLKETKPSAEDLQILKNRLYQEKDIPVLKQIVSNLSLAVAEFPQTREILLGFAKECAHPDLCGFVDGVIQSMPGQKPTP